MKRIIVILFLSFFAIISCKKENTTVEDIFGGRLTKIYVNSLAGMEGNLVKLLDDNNMSYSEFLLMTTDSAWVYPKATQEKLKKFRKSIEYPTERTLFQKIIHVGDMDTYINNLYGGTLGGFISVAGDLKKVYTMHDVYHGLRLDYKDSEFKEDASSYAVIRFYTDLIDDVEIPFCEELGGTYPHLWPNGGGGFTTSSLGLGGYPEYRFLTYVAPNAGAELYEVNRNGYEILRAKYSVKDKWQIVDKGYSPKSKSTSNLDYELKHVVYKGEKFFLRATIKGVCHLTTFTKYPSMQLNVIEKGVWGIEVSEKEVEVI